MVSLEFNRFLEYYRNRQEIETPTEIRGEQKDKLRRVRGESLNDGNRKAEAGFRRLFINFGKMDNFFPSQLIDLINRNVPQQRVGIGRIDLMRNFSFFEVEEKTAPTVVKALGKATIGGRKVTVEFADEGLKKEYNHATPNRQQHVTRRTTIGEERSYTATHSIKQDENLKKQDDWKQFFNKETPSFMEAKRKPKKMKNISMG
jgi:ATP-dependent RNA helicase DeaD